MAFGLIKDMTKLFDSAKQTKMNVTIYSLDFGILFTRLGFNFVYSELQN